MMDFKVSPLTKIISLSGFLALGFLLVILSCALFHNYYPLFDIVIFLLAPIPNTLFNAGNKYHTSDFMSDSSNTGQDLAHFLTGMLVTSGVALPVVFNHCQLIGHLSCIMCMIGGLIIYSSIVIFKWFFKKDFNEDDSLFG
ncbi:vps55p [Saccharomyces arboricola H-6]|uniref:Vps55p n=1 Tax=Saccharomyces arboricola (strain H-6 / AS 2.3317 / CBS 10644) TaxID=1160507 RepID=J8PLQ2_SACAR|nr:vps55p [Saccharomyces arboricola H-6]